MAQSIPPEKIQRYRDLRNRVLAENPDNPNEVANALRILRKLETEYPGIREACEGKPSGDNKPPWVPYVERVVGHTLSTLESVANQAVTDFLQPNKKESKPMSRSKKNPPSADETKGLSRSSKAFTKRLNKTLTAEVDADTVSAVQSLFDADEGFYASEATYRKNIKELFDGKSPPVLIELRLPLDVVLGIIVDSDKAGELGYVMGDALANHLGFGDDEEDTEDEETGDEDTGDEDSD